MEDEGNEKDKHKYVQLPMSCPLFINILRPPIVITCKQFLFNATLGQQLLTPIDKELGRLHCVEVHLTKLYTN